MVTMSRHRQALRILVIALALPACADTARPGHEVERVEQEILDEIGRYYEDFSARDWDAFASHFWEGATLTTVWQPPAEPEPRVVITSVEDFVRLAPLGPGSREIFEERMISAEVRTHGDLAHVWARYQARFGDPGDIIEWQGIDAFTLMKQAGRWRIVALAYAAG
jgi:hypothetical protein